MVLVPLLIVPVLMVAAALAERRLGPFAAGWIAALPVGFAVAVVAVVLDAGGAAASAMARSAAAHVIAQVVLAVVVAAVLPRCGLLVGTLAGTFAYLACALGVRLVPDLLAVAVAVPALAMAPHLINVAPPRPASAPRWSTTALSCAACSVLVGAALLSERLAGPAVAGAVAAFPTMTGTLAATVAARAGSAAAAQVLLGLVRSLPCYLTFCLVIVMFAPVIGLGAIPTALMFCVAVASLVWRSVPLTPRPSI